MDSAAPDSHALLTIVRHGQTSANVDGLWHGSTNTPLTYLGHTQAAAAGAFIESNLRPVTHVYTSPLDRAHHTAQAIAGPLGLTPIIEKGLVEFDLGAWEGMPFKTLYKEKNLFENMKSDPNFNPHGGESPRQVGDRLAGALREISARHPGERIVVVTHGAALSIAFGVLLDNDYTCWDRMMNNCGISELALAPPPSLISFNRIEHLPSEEAPIQIR